MEVVYLKRAWTKTVLEWRCHLLRMAIDILSIPAMSAEAGRVFSGGTVSNTTEQGSLGSEDGGTDGMPKTLAAKRLA